MCISTSGIAIRLVRFFILAHSSIFQIALAGEIGGSMASQFVLSDDAVNESISALLSRRAEGQEQLALLPLLPANLTHQIDLQLAEIAKLDAVIDELSRYQASSIAVRLLLTSHANPAFHQSL